MIHRHRCRLDLGERRPERIQPASLDTLLVSSERGDSLVWNGIKNVKYWLGQSFCFYLLRTLGTPCLFQMANFCTLSLNIATPWSASPANRETKHFFQAGHYIFQSPHAVSILHSAFFRRPLPAKEMVPWWPHLPLCMGLGLGWFFSGATGCLLPPAVQHKDRQLKKQKSSVNTHP